MQIHFGQKAPAHAQKRFVVTLPPRRVLGVNIPGTIDPQARKQLEAQIKPRNYVATRLDQNKVLLLPQRAYKALMRLIESPRDPLSPYSTTGSRTTRDLATDMVSTDIIKEKVAKDATHIDLSQVPLVIH